MTDRYNLSCSAETDGCMKLSDENLDVSLFTTFKRMGLFSYVYGMSKSSASLLCK